MRSSGPRRIVIIGGGIVGAALAAQLSQLTGLAITVVEAGPAQRLVGSTGYAPGFVGLLNESAVATALARASADEYAQIRHGGRAGLDRVGGLEVATTPAGMADLERRAGLATSVGLPAQVLDAAQAGVVAAPLVDPARCLGGVLYRSDGTARPATITSGLRERARLAGVSFVYGARVVAIESSSAAVRAVRTTEHTFPADDVVVACGIWGPAVAALAGEFLPLVPVAHPYVYGPSHGAQPTAAPFVRWPEQHVYARDHGDRLGLGSYDHRPLPVTMDELGEDAEQPWATGLFDPAIHSAMELLPEVARFTVQRRISGVFAMTPDNLPLLGRAQDVDGLWMAEALW